ncbi:conjugative transposon protein TraK [Filimonas effusa]|uniref:Conjugative transposon protein TraK n=1 Tax=Filimonas effusa TaxID=2508721 RepID=A0A4Q1D1E0_9BACT|nr:conjugative transposon protein TraK [Filimonas effusa]RXK81666.1 conjugative transposon protein TraK [Filimonas effusa]
MFQQFKNIESAFKHIRLFTAVVIIATIIINCYTIYKSYLYAGEAQQRVFVIVNGKAIQAVAASRKDNVPIEAGDHIKVFHSLFFSLTPDEKAIQAGLSKAMYLADKSAKDQYDDLKEAGYYDQVVSGNISQEVTCDSVHVDIDHHPYPFRFYGKLRIVRPTSTVTRNLITDGVIRDLNTRTENNPHGFLIERWTIVDNTDLTVKQK